MAYTKLGRIRPVYKGTWSSSAEYATLDIVKNTDGDRAYIALKDVPKGTALTSAAYWGAVLDVSDVLAAADEAIAAANKAAALAPKPLELTENAQPAAVWPEEGSSLRPVITMEPVQSGKGDPSPDNIRPISGRTDVKVMRAGRNLFPGGASITVNRNTDFTLPVTLPPGTYTVSGKVTTTDTDESRSSIGFRNRDTHEIDKYVGFKRTGEREVFTVTLEYYTDVIRLLAATNISTGTGDTAVWTEVQIESGSAATEYEPYRGEAFTLSLGQTVYSGTLDTASGVLTIDRACEIFESFSTKSSTTVSDVYLRNRSTAKPWTSVICSHAKPAGGYADVPGAWVNGSGSISWNFAEAGTTTVDDVNQYLQEQAAAGKPVQFCYELKTPVTVQLNPDAIPAQAGLNTVFSGGEGMTLAYNKSLAREHEEFDAAMRSQTYSAPVQSLWEQRMIERIDQTMIPMPALRRMAKASSGYIPKGTILTGMNYSSVSGYDHGLVGSLSTQTSPSTYYSALENPASVMYTEDLYQDEDSCSTHYGITCSAFAAFAFGLSAYLTTEGLADTYRNNMLDIDNTSAEGDLFQIRRGDLLLNTLVTTGKSNHAKIVRDVLYDRATGRLVGFNVADSWKPFVRVVFMTPSEFLAQMRETQPYRVTRIPQSDMNLTIDPIHYSRSVYPDKGDGGRYDAGTAVWLYIPDETAVSVIVDGTSYDLSAMTKKIVNDVIVYRVSANLTAGTHTIAVNTAPDDACTIRVT